VKGGLEKRFPWLNTNGLGGGCLGLESEGWFDTWNLLQALQLRNKFLGKSHKSKRGRKEITFSPSNVTPSGDLCP
jgi:hypothetical protein